jgi:hypothetical protein
MATKTAREIYFDFGENLDVFQILGQGGGLLCGQTINGLSYGTKNAQDNVTATPSGTQLNSILLTSVNRFTIVASAGDSATLPVGLPGMQVVVINDAASNAMNVFPDAGSKINASGTNAAFSLTVAAGPTIFYCTAVGQWRTK